MASDFIAPIPHPQRSPITAVSIMFLKLLPAILLLTSRASFALEQEVEAKINHHLQQGNNALSTGNLDIAIQNYESCLELDPDQRYCAINYASALVDMNELHGDQQDQLGKQNRAAKAQSILKHTLRVYPRDGDAAFNLALLLQDSSRSEEITLEAAKLYEIAVKASLEDEDGEERWDAWANMAAAKQELGHFLGPYGARRAYERSILLLEGMVNEYQNYFDHLLNGDSEDYDETEFHRIQSEINGINAYLSKLYYGYGTILSELDPIRCLELMSEEDSLLIDTKEGVDEESAKMVCEANAMNAMRLAVDLDGNNAVAGHMLAAMTEGEEGGDRKKRASNEFVSALFDDFADTFDEKLGALGYKVPQLVGEVAFELLQQSGRTVFQSALDAGCGTGLAGRFLRSLVAGPIVGVDLSKKMLELAAQCTILKGCGLKDDDAATTDDNEGDDRSTKKLYDHLASLDLETTTLEEMISGNEALSDAKGGFDLIVAADVLVYFGDIQKLLMNFSKLSSQTSHLIFSCERIEDEDAPELGWKLQSSGRYAHSKSYVVGAAKNAGYELAGYNWIVPRKERGEEVKGHLFRFVLGGENEAKDEL